MNKKLYAFWKYDLFPYVLGGEVTDINDDGLVYIESYQARFRPILILPFEKGKKINQEIEKIKNSYDNEFKKLRKEKLKEIIDICPQLLPNLQI